MNKSTLTCSISIIFSLAPCQAEVTTDGTVGALQNLAGPDFAINQELGTLNGANLFHSFSQFNLTQGQSATFTGDAAIQNVISRVTGGEVSNIDGLIKSEIGQAAVYFINPAGIVFGQNAKVDVPGAFHASTANELQFADGSKFSATNEQASSLSMAAPSAFGFLAHTAANNGLLRVEGATLEVKPGQSLDLVAGEIETYNATLRATQKTVGGADPETLGRGIRLVAVQGAGTVGLDRSEGALPLPETTPSSTNAGDIFLQDTSIIASGNGGGRIGIWGGNVAALRDTRGRINAVNTSTQHAASQQGIKLKTANLMLDGITVRTETEGNRNAGDVEVTAAGYLLVSDGEISSYTSADGQAGDVAIKANIISLDHGQVYSTTTAWGDAGDVSVYANGNINLDQESYIGVSPLGNSTYGNAGRIIVNAIGDIKLGRSSFISAITRTDGQGGDFTVFTKGDLQVEDGSAIGTYTVGSGPAGDVKVFANNISLDNGAILSGSYGPDSSGQTGQIRLVANNSIVMSSLSWISVENEAILTDAAAQRTTPGTINLSARDIYLTNSLITTDAAGNAPAGNISINFAHWLTADSSTLIRSTAASGNGGAITILGGELLSLRNAGIVTTVESGQGNGGNINVNADILLLDTGSIQANGDINLNLKALIVPQLNIVGDLFKLNSPELDLSHVGRDPCSEALRHSTLKKLGKGGVPLLNKGQDGYTIEHLLETAPSAGDSVQQAADLRSSQADCQPKPTSKPLQQALRY